MDKSSATLIASIVAATASLVSLFISYRLTIRSERKQALWKKEIDRFFQLEEVSGEIVETLLSGNLIFEPEFMEGIINNIQTLKAFTGKLRRYERVSNAIEAFREASVNLISVNRKNLDDFKEKRDLESKFRLLLIECDKVTERNQKF